MVGTVYLVTNLLNGKMYVGCTERADSSWLASTTEAHRKLAEDPIWVEAASKVLFKARAVWEAQALVRDAAYSLKDQARRAKQRARNRRYYARHHAVR